MAFSSHAQISQFYAQGFETSEPVTYTVTGQGAAQASIVSGGQRAMKLTHNTTGSVTLELDTIDFSSNGTLTAYVLEFMHVAMVDPTKCAIRAQVCTIEAKRPNQTGWTLLGSTYYNTTEGGSSDYVSTASFSKHSYEEWRAVNTANNSMWKKERFDLNYMFNNVATADKKIQIRFTLAARNATGATQDAWYIDDLKVTASNQPIVAPVINMLAFPDQLNYPSSRGAKISCEVSTTVVQGINPDSVYVVYRIGNSNQQHRAPLSLVSGSTNRYTGRIPFCGYDTMMHYRVVVKDATTNNNTKTFPLNTSTWMNYRCVRGKTNTASLVGNQSNVSLFPFPAYADNWSEMIYDSAMLAERGYAPGAITNFSYIVSSAMQTISRPNLRIRMANRPSSYVRNSEMTQFTKDPMQLVYQGLLSIEQAAPNSVKNIALQDTFFYAGGDIVVQFSYDGNSDLPNGTQIKHIPVANNQKLSLFVDGMEAALGYNAFDNPNFATGFTSNTRPDFQFYEYKNVPLVHDAGICAFSYPNYEIPCVGGTGTTDSVSVWLKNFGAATINAIRIGYKVDNSAPAYYDWTGSLAAGDSVRVHLTEARNFTIGYHTMTSWVEDTLTSGADRIRDHEPYNDTSYTPFIACGGPMSGVRNIGGTNADFQTLDQFLYALSRCGLDGQLTAKLAAGTYDVTTLPVYSRGSAYDYVTIEPASATQQNVVFRPSHDAAALLNMDETGYFRFNRIKFARSRYGAAVTYLVKGNRRTKDVRFNNCVFIDSTATLNNACAALIYSVGDSVHVNNCSFVGGGIGVQMAGVASDNRASGNKVFGSEFVDQFNSAVQMLNQNYAIVDSNYMNDVITNSSYIVMARNCYQGSRVTRNKIYSSHGACCLGVSDFHGSASNYALVANNMLVSLDDGTTNLLTTPLNIIKGSYMKVVFNSVRMNAPTRVNVAAATFGGDVISNSYFQNNVIATFDQDNYAFSYMPGTNADNLFVNHNCYYSVSGLLNKLSGTSHLNLASWNAAVASESGSVFGNPNYTNGSRVDLRSFNALLRNIGVPVAEVPTDIFNTVRNATSPSLGAYEVSALSVDFEPVGFVTPYDEYCGYSSNIPVEVIIRNTGVGTYNPAVDGNLNVYYTINNGALVTFTANRSVGPNDTMHYLSTRIMNLPSNGQRDSIHHIKLWVKNTQDPDDLNDTIRFDVLSHYAEPAPTAINQNVPYGTSATVNVTAGVNNWPINYYLPVVNVRSPRQQQSAISWFHSPTDTEPFFYGNPLVTDELFTDTTFYISQKRDLPLMKITEVQVSRSAAGATNPMPSWMGTSTNFAIEMTNCGDYPANLEGDTILIVSPTTSLNNKIWVLPNVTVQPGSAVVLQFRTNNTASDSSRTIYCPSTAVVAPAYNANFGIIYRDGHGIADAVPFNAVITTSSTQAVKWSTQGVPNEVWQGPAIQMTTAAGARRISWPTVSASGSIQNTQSQWQVASAEHPMHMGEVEENLIRYRDNGCLGEISTVTLHLTDVPVTDLAIEAPEVNEGCGLYNEPVSVVLHNFGAQATSQVVVKYSTNNGATIACADTIASGLAAGATITHTFSTPLYMHAASDTIYNVLVWVDALASDGVIRHLNDTASASFTSLFTPEMPLVITYDTVNYADSAVLTAFGIPANQTLAWFDAHHNALDTTNVLVTPYIYHPDTFYVKAIALADLAETHIGTLATLSSATAYPSPYNPKTKYVKEQYIYTAEQIRAAGHTAGTISSLAFYLGNVPDATGEFTFNNYTIKMDSTTLNIFANTNFVTGLHEVYSAQNLTLGPNNLGWVSHKLDNTFEWNGTSNLIIEVCHDLSTTGITTGAQTRYTAQANTVLTKQNATTDQATVTSGAIKGGNRPDLLIGFLEPVGCGGPEAPIYIAVSGVPSHDGALEWSLALDTMVIASCDTTTIPVTINNMGLDTITNYTFTYSIDGGAPDTTAGILNLPLGYSVDVPLFSQYLSPGRHTIAASLFVPGDTTLNNNSISRTFNVRFCAGTYTVGTAAGSDFTTMTATLDTLHNAGVAGPVVFSLAPETFTSQLTFGNVEGLDSVNTLTFETQPGNNTQARIVHTPTTAANYVATLNGVHHVLFRNIEFYANYTTGSGNNIFANVLKIDAGDHITFDSCTIRSKKTTASTTNANLVLIGDGIRDLTITNSTLDSGYYAIRTVGATTGSNFTFTNNAVKGFWFQGFNIRNIDNVTINANDIKAGVTVNGKPFTGISVANANGLSVQRNSIYLTDNATGGKRGIQIAGCTGTNLNRVTVYNNMISLYGSGVASLPSAGIWVDSLSRYVSVYFNTVRLYAGANANATRAFSVQLSSNVHVLNNIFSNFSQGYAYYVASDTNVANSDYNVYFTNAIPNANTGVRRYVHWVADSSTIESLRAVNGKDLFSIDEEPYFYDEYDLRLRIAQFSGLAQYNPDVPVDIFGETRIQPNPTIGAFELARAEHNISIARIILPEMPANANDVRNIETDSIDVLVEFYNNGSAYETDCSWFCQLLGTAVVSPRRLLDLPVRTAVLDSVRIPSPLGIQDTQIVKVFLSMPNGVVDTNMDDNELSKSFFIHPAFDLAATVATITNNTPAGCRLHDVPVTITLRNAGKKDFPGNASIDIGVEYYVSNPANISLPNMPGLITEMITLGSDLPVGTTRDVTFSPANYANLYPVGYNGDITVRLRGFYNYDHDIKYANDTTPWINVQSNHTPPAPEGVDTTIPYGVYTQVHATQVQSRVIRWHRDSNDVFFFNGNNNYSRSTCWSTTPQYFSDSTYYLSCLSTKNCTSYYSPVTVHVLPPVQTDVSIQEVLSPRASGRVYNAVDTVTLALINYGVQPVSNIPVVYRFMNANGTTVLAEVRDTCRRTINPNGDTIHFSFDSLLYLNTPVSNVTYSLQAYVDHPSDQVRINDTLHTNHTFRSLAESAYQDAATCAPTDADGFDITHVSFNTLDNYMPDLIGYTRLNLGTYNNPEVPMLRMQRGTTDTLTVEVALNTKEGDFNTAASLMVCIDYNRDGVYDMSGKENITRTAPGFGVKVRSRQPFKLPYTVPADAHFGAQRMMVWVQNDSTAFINGFTDGEPGQVQEYILFVEEPGTQPEIDAALTRMVSPLNDNHVVTADDTVVSFMMANKGTTPIAGATIAYIYADEDTTTADVSNTYNWTGLLEPGQSTLVTLPAYTFPEGTTHFTATVRVDGDSNSSNNSIATEFHRYHVVVLRLNDAFDDVHQWYAPAGTNAYTRNYFERGTPAKTNLTMAYSEPNCWVTSLTQSVVTGTRGNRSELYSPIIDIRQIRPDTISFLLSKNLANESHLRLEYFSYLGEWVSIKLSGPKAVPGAKDEELDWYDDEEGWTGNSREFEYVRYSFASSEISGEFPQDLQFRFVYTTPKATAASAAFGEGCAIDNFYIGRARRDIDVGVTEITYPVEPRFGETIYPRCIIHNYGYDTITNFDVAYRPYGTYLPMLATCHQRIVPGGDIEFEFPTAFVVTNDFPDTFDICAFTDVSRDLYKDNDTTCSAFGLSPLDNDMYLYAIVAPGSRAVAGDSLDVTLRLRNFGVQPISSATASFVFNEGAPVTETINFEQLLGEPLQSMEFFNYTFRHRVRATMGTMQLMAYCNYAQDAYRLNDTIRTQISGISAITDIRATEIIIDTTDINNTSVSLVLDNVGARMANSFEVGYWIDNDESTLYRETFYRENGIPAGGRALHIFPALPERSARYSVATAYCHILDDNNPANDTTSTVAEQYIDIEILRVEVEENMNDSCRVRIQVINRGNLTERQEPKATSQVVINGTSIKGIRFHQLEPGIPYYLMMKKKVVKNRQREYVGTGRYEAMADANGDNNITSKVVVVNYFEGIPAVVETDLTLEQNYPNPFNDATRIEFFLPYSGQVTFFVTDGLGRKVHQATSYYEGGRNTINFNSKDLASGVYYYGIEFDGERRMRKMIIK